MPAILLEGPEKSGKTTAAREILARWQGVGPAHYWHNEKGDSVPDAIQAMAEMARSAAQSPTRLLVIDRWYLSAWVYGGQRELTITPELLELPRALGMRCAIMMRDSATLAANRRPEDGQGVSVPTEIKRYRALATLMRIPCVFHPDTAAERLTSINIWKSEIE